MAEAVDNTFIDADGTSFGDDINFHDDNYAISLHISAKNIAINSGEIVASSFNKAVGISVSGISQVRVADNIRINTLIKMSSDGNTSGYGIYNSGGDLVLGDNTGIKVTNESDNNKNNSATGICVGGFGGGGKTVLGAGSTVAVKTYNGTARAVEFSSSGGSGSAVLGDNIRLTAEVANSKTNSGRSIGVLNENGSELTVGNGLSIESKMRSLVGGMRAKAEGFVNYSGSSAKGNVVIGDSLKIITSAEATTGQVSSYGIYNYDSKIKIGSGALVTSSGSGHGTVSVNGFVNYDAATAELADNITIIARGKKEGTGQAAIKAVENTENSKMTFGNNIVLSAEWENENASGDIKLRGIDNEDGSAMKFGNNVNVSATAVIDGADVMAVYNVDGSKLDFGDNASIIGKSSLYGLGVGIFNNESEITFDGSVSLEGSDYAIYNIGNGTVDVKVEGKQKIIWGDVYSASNSVTNLLLDTADSLFLGAAGLDNTGETNLQLANGAQWQMQGNSAISELKLSNSGVVDMTQYSSYQNVTAADYIGNEGVFVMKTDLASETDGDKVNITNAAAGTTYVQVKDASLTNGVEVTGVKNLLLITDASQTADFVGKNLNAGGLWDVTPTIERGTEAFDAAGNSIGTADQWYLTKIEKAVNNDTKVLLDAVDNSYALWRNTNDSLRKRLGELRFRTDAADGDGIWARYTGGKFSGSGFDSSYNMYQLGYDKAADAKSTYGLAVDSGTGHADYAAGGGKDKLMALSLYGTWMGEKGSYTDVVARVGQFDTDVDSYGDYPDKASYKNHAYSLSVEYGKTFELSKESGTFIEPQAQFILGRLGSSSYTTDRGTAVAVDGMNSAIARLGVVVGKKINDGSDFYFKASALHEFAGERDISMRAANGEVLAGSNDYGDTWFELGLGGNVKLGRASHLYGDIERSFGADIQKKWQINAGVRFEF